MKIKKTAEQKNFVIDMDYFAVGNDFENDLARGKEWIKPYIGMVIDGEARIFASNCKEIKVIYNEEFEKYQTVIVGIGCIKDGINNDIIPIKL